MRKASGEICFVLDLIAEHPLIRDKYLSESNANSLGYAVSEEMLGLVTAWPKNDYRTTLHEFAHLLQYTDWDFFDSSEFNSLAQSHVDYVKRRWTGYESLADDPIELFAEGCARFHLDREDLARHAPKLYSYFKGLPARLPTSTK